MCAKTFFVVVSPTVNQTRDHVFRFSRCVVYVCVCAQMSYGKGKKRARWSLNEVIGMVGIGLKSLGFLLHAFLDFQDGRRLRLILQTMNKPEWLKQIEMGPSLLLFHSFKEKSNKILKIFLSRF